MAEIHRQEIIESLVKGLRLATGKDKVPKEIASKIVPVFIAEEEGEQYFKSTTWNATQSYTTVETIPDNKDLYITSVSMSYEKNASCDLSGVSLTSWNFAGTIPNIPILELRTLGAASAIGADNATITFNKPLKIPGGKTRLLYLNSTFTAGAMYGNLIIHGYYKQKP